jgi:glucuronate isomerase
MEGYDFALDKRRVAFTDCGTYSNEHQIDTYSATHCDSCSTKVASMVKYRLWHADRSLDATEFGGF